MYNYTSHGQNLRFIEHLKFQCKHQQSPIPPHREMQSIEDHSEYSACMEARGVLQ